MLKNISEEMVIKIIGCLLIAMEIYKQLFYYYIIGNGAYDVWIFPFQLCSMPMYLCIIYIFIGKKGKGLILDFFMSYNLLGGIAAFIDPSGMITKYLSLTLHGILWHIILIFLGIYSGLRLKQRKMGKFINVTILFLGLAIIAQMINWSLRGYGSINMFYISLWEPMTQIVFKNIAREYGQVCSVTLYIVAIIVGAWIVWKTWQKKQKSS